MMIKEVEMNGRVGKYWFIHSVSVTPYTYKDSTKVTVTMYCYDDLEKTNFKVYQLATRVGTALYKKYLDVDNLDTSKNYYQLCEELYRESRPEFKDCKIFGYDPDKTLQEEVEEYYKSLEE